MKTPAIALALLITGVLAATAQHYRDLSEWMKSLDKASTTLSKPDHRTGPEAVENAEEIGVVYENMIDFWRQQHAADAVKWSEQGKAAAVELAAAAHAGHAGRATAAFQTISETCRACHEAHRETLAGGGYRIK